MKALYVDVRREREEQNDDLDDVEHPAPENDRQPPLRPELLQLRQPGRVPGPPPPGFIRLRLRMSDEVQEYDKRRPHFSSQQRKTERTKMRTEDNYDNQGIIFLWAVDDRNEAIRVSQAQNARYSRNLRGRMRRLRLERDTRPINGDT